MLCLAAIITFQLLFEFTKCRELSDIDGNIVPSFQIRVLKAFLHIFKVVSWDLQVPAIPCSVVGVLGPMKVFIPKAFGTLSADYFACHN